MQHTGQVLKLARKTQNLTLRELADLSEVDYTTLSRIENGHIDPPARTVKAITEALGKSMAGVS